MTDDVSVETNGWCHAELDALVRLVNGDRGSNYPSKSDFLGSGVPFINAGHLRDGKVSMEDMNYIGQDHFSRLGNGKVKDGDILFCLRGSLGKTALVKEIQAGAIASSLVIVRPHVSGTTRYLYYFLMSPLAKSQIGDFDNGSAQPNLSAKSLGKFRVSLAPLAEQKRIADKLDAVLARVDACRERLDRVPAILKRFRQSVLAAATSGALTEDWRADTGCHSLWSETRLGDLADIQGGVTKDQKKQSAADEEVPYLRVANVQRGFIDLTEVKTIRVPASKLAALLLEPGDILFNEGGDLDKLGRGWIWEGQVRRCTFQNHVFRARLFDKRNQPKYISWWGNYRGLNYFLAAGKQTTNLASINKSMLTALPISLPPFEEQQEIVRRVETLFAYADRLEARYKTAREQVERLTPALLAKAFRGELVPQDPNEEPASVLLERLRAQRATDSAAGPQSKARARRRESC